MPRVKKGTMRNKSRRTTLKAVKGYRHGRSSKKKLATEAIKHAGRNALRDRRKKKGVFRRLWITRLNAAVKEEGISYSKFIDMMNKKKIGLNRKVLSEIAKDNPESFKRIIDEVK